MPETNEPETPAPAPAAPAAPAFDPSALVGAVIEANRRAANAETRAEQAAQYAAASRPQAPRGPDPLDKLSTEDLTLQPDQKKALLSQAIQERAAAISARQMQQVREEASRERESMRAEMALNQVMAMRPELSDPSNSSNFAAAMTKAKFEAEARGIALSPAQLASSAASMYDQMFKRSAERPPFVEGTNPALSGPPGGTAPNGPTPQSELESIYGIKAGKIRPPYNIKDSDQMNALNNEYVNSRNKKMLERGVSTDLAAIAVGE